MSIKLLSDDVLVYILQYIGFYDELTPLRYVNSYFRKYITNKCIIGLRVNNDDLYVLKITHNWLIILLCSGQNFTYLPPLPNVVILDCSNNLIKKLPPLPKNKLLICSNNYLKCLPNLPENRILLCNHNNLKSIQNLPTNEELDCRNNNIISVSNLLKNKIIYISNNPHTSFINLPENEKIDFIHAMTSFYTRSNKNIWMRYIQSKYISNINSSRSVNLTTSLTRNMYPNYKIF